MRGRLQVVAGYAVPVAWIAGLLAVGGTLSPWLRLAGATVGLLYSIKVGALLVLRGRGADLSMSPLATVLFWTVWPGVRADTFDSGEPPDPDGETFVRGYLFAVGGALLGLATLLSVPRVGTGPASWLLLAAGLMIVHQGVGRLLPFALRWLGVATPDLFDDPLASRSVGEFWARRWNRPFVEMDRLFVTRPLAPRVGIAVAALVAFAVSGALHELAISYPTGAGWGTPMVYFAVQAVAYTAEKTILPEDLGAVPVLGRLWTWGVVLLPVPLLFHAPFRGTFLVPVLEGGRELVLSVPLGEYLAIGLWLAAAGHALVLVASSQVPAQLEWDEDLASLTPFNRKLMWTYGAFIVYTIVAFGALTAAFHAQFLAGTPVALGLAAMIALFWSARIVTDVAYFDHDDWPEGVAFVVGHALLTSLFAFLVLVYGGTVLYHLA